MLSTLLSDAGLPSQLGNIPHNEWRISTNLIHPQNASIYHRSTQNQGTHNHHYLPLTHKMISSRPTLTTSKSLGQFPETYHITVRDDTKPVIHAPRKCPIAMQIPVHDKLDEFINQGIIVPVTEPKDWVSSLIYLWKGNDQLHMSLDPRDINLAIKQDHHRTPVVEKITHELDGSTCFTKFDGISSCLLVFLDYKSSVLTTFNTSLGWYCFFSLHWVKSVHKTSSDAWWTRYLTTMMVWLELQMMV